MQPAGSSRRAGSPLARKQVLSERGLPIQHELRCVGLRRTDQVEGTSPLPPPQPLTALGSAAAADGANLPTRDSISQVML